MGPGSAVEVMGKGCAPVPPRVALPTDLLLSIGAAHRRPTRSRKSIGCAHQKQGGYLNFLLFHSETAMEVSVCAGTVEARLGAAERAARKLAADLDALLAATMATPPPTTHHTTRRRRRRHSGSAKVRATALSAAAAADAHTAVGSGATGGTAPEGFEPTAVAMPLVQAALDEVWPHVHGDIQSLLGDAALSRSRSPARAPCLALPLGSPPRPLLAPHLALSLSRCPAHHLTFCCSLSLSASPPRSLPRHDVPLALALLRWTDVHVAKTAARPHIACVHPHHSTRHSQPQILPPGVVSQDT